MLWWAEGHGAVADVEVVALRVDGLEMDGTRGVYGDHGEGRRGMWFDELSWEDLGESESREKRSEEGEGE